MIFFRFCLPEVACSSHIGYVGKYRAGQIYHKHTAYASCDRAWVSYSGFVQLVHVGQMVMLSCYKLETGSQRKTVQSHGSDLQLFFSISIHTAQTPRRAVKICYLSFLLLAYGAALEGTQRVMLDGRSGRAQVPKALLSGAQQKDEGSMVVWVQVSQCQ